MRENRTHGSEGGEAEPSLPLYLACRGRLSVAGEAREASSPAPPRREHRKAVPLRGTTNNEARTDAGPALALR